VVGAGAAGLWSALCAGRRLARKQLPPDRLSIVVLDAREKFGAKILMSGGTRCNLTHVEVTPDDFRGGNRNRIARVLRAMSEKEARRIFEEELGLPTKTEPNGKVFPADDSARSVLQALVRGLERHDIAVRGGSRCVDLVPKGDGRWQLHCVDPGGAPLPPLFARRVILGTGGLSFPKSGSDGAGLEMMRRLGHTIVYPVPALTPVVLDSPYHAHLAGIATPVALDYLEDGRSVARCVGPMLWTHFGLSGPAALDVSGLWARTRADRPTIRREVFASFLPEESTESLEARWLESARRHPASTLRTLVTDLPRRLLDTLLEHSGLDPARPLAQTPKDERRRALLALLRFPLPVIDVLGFNKAEVTSGGVPLEEIDPKMESRILPGIHLVGEMVHVDGRLGGFNFQWAWSSGCVAGESAVDALLSPPGGDLTLHTRR